MMKRVEVFILAGGKSSRMGQDKGLVHFHGRPLIAHVLDVAKNVSSSINIVTSNSDYLIFGCPLVKDIVPDKGPAGGVFTALTFAKEPFVLVVGCDMPMLDKRIIDQMMEMVSSVDLVVASRNGQVEPLLAIYNTGCKHKWSALLHSGFLKMSDFFDRLNTRVFDVSAIPDLNDSIFMNINSPEELATAEGFVRILCFGKLRDILPPSQEFEWSVGTVAGLRSALFAAYPGLMDKTFRIAVNHAIVGEDAAVLPGAEIALMPPFSGG